MRTVLWLEWQGFYAAEGEEPEVVLRDGYVLDANENAQRRGIVTGMSFQQARNVVPTCRKKEWLEEDYVERQQRWLDLCLPFTGLIDPLDGHIAALDLTGHPRPLEIAEVLIGNLVREVGLPLRYGFGPSKWVAALASRKHDLHKAIADPARFLSGLTVSHLTPIETAHKERLAFLGYRKIGEVTQIPLEVLRLQFGEVGLRIAQAARGSLADPVRPLYPKDLVSSTLTFDGAPDTLEVLENGLRKLSRELGDLLVARNAIGKRVDLELTHEDGTATSLTRTFTRSLVTERDLFGALRLMLPVPPETPVERVWVRLPHLKQARRVQLDTNDGRSRSDLQESIQTAMMHVRTTFGETSVRLGSEIVEPRWRQVRRAYRDFNGWAWV